MIEVFLATFSNDPVLGFDWLDEVYGADGIGNDVRYIDARQWKQVLSVQFNI